MYLIKIEFARGKEDEIKTLSPSKYCGEKKMRAKH